MSDNVTVTAKFAGAVIGGAAAAAITIGFILGAALGSWGSRADRLSAINAGILVYDNKAYILEPLREPARSPSPVQ